LIACTACVVCAQGDPVESLLAVPLETREKLLDKALEEKALDGIRDRITAGLKDAEAQGDEEFKTELTKALSAQKNALAELIGFVQRAPITEEALAEEIRRLKAKPGDPVADQEDPSKVGDLEVLRSWQGKIQTALDAREAALRDAEAKVAALKARGGPAAVIEQAREAVAKTEAEWQTALAQVQELEAAKKEERELWPVREDAFLKLIRLKASQADLAADEKEATPEILKLQVEGAETARDREEEGVARAREVLKAFQDRVEAEDRKARQARERDRGHLEERLKAASPHEKPFIELRIATLENNDRTAEAQGNAAPRSSGALAEEAEALRQELEEEDLAYSSDELKRRVEEKDDKLAQLRVEIARLAAIRKAARQDRREAINQRSADRRDLDEEGLLGAAAAAGEPTWRREEWGSWFQDYRASLENWEAANENLLSATAPGYDKLIQAEKSLSGSVDELRSRLLWSREESLISTETLEEAAADLGALPAYISDAVGETVNAWVEVATAEDNRGRLMTTLALALALAALLWLIHRKLPSTYTWLESREGKNAGIWRIIATGIRRSELMFMLAALYCGTCAVWDVWPWETGAVAVLFLGPFCYRFVRVLLDVLFHPTDPDDRLIDVENSLAKVLHRAGRWLLLVSALFVGVGAVMESGGYGERNPGFLQFWWFIYTTVFSVILLIGVCRPAVFSQMIRGEGRVATSAKTLVLVLYPLVVASALFLLVINALRYHVAVDYFSVRLASSVGVVAAAVLLYRALLRRMLPNRDWSRSVRSEDFDDEQQFLAEGRRWFWDMMGRSVIRLLVLVPAILVMANTWGDMNWGFLHAPMSGGDDGLSLSGLFLGLVAIYATVALVKHYRRWLLFVILPGTKLDQGLSYAVMTLTSYGVVTVGVVIVLNLLRVQGDQIAYVVSALMLGIGFGLKDLVTNFISGIMLLVERPLKVGDQVVIGDQMGTVEKINLRSTTIMTFDNVGVVVPNGDLVTGTLINRSSGTPLLRTTIPVGVGYDSDPREVMEIIQGCLDDHGLVLNKPGPSIYFVGFGADSLDFSVRFWARMSDNRMQIAGDLRAAFLARFRDAGIEIPFPQRDLHLRSADPEAVIRTTAVAPPTPPVRKVTRTDPAVGLPEQPSDEDAQRDAAHDTDEAENAEERSGS